MILLADTNVVIDFLKAVRENDKNSPYIAIFKSQEIVLCGAVRAELLHGAYSDKNQKELQQFVSCYPSADLIGADWNVMGSQLYAYRKQGMTVPFTDATIASIALKYGMGVWTNDKHFDMMKSVIPELAVYRTEELLTP